MAEKRPGDGTAIGWTHVPGYKGETWNPTTGCTRVSPGCDHCYAFTLHDRRYAQNKAAAWEFLRPRTPQIAQSTYNAVARNEGAVLPWPKQYDIPFSTVQVLDDHRIEAPLRAKAPRAYFVDSMADLFHEDVPDSALDHVYDVMEATPQHIYMILTKRPERMRDYVTARRIRQRRLAHVHEAALPAHIWHGTSTEDQERLDERVPPLLDTPSVVHFISAEPLLGPIDLRPRPTSDLCIRCGDGPDAPHAHRDGYRTRGLSWVIVGGESGPRHRPMDDDWARAIREQCATADVAYFYKQPSGAKPGGRGPSDLAACKAFPKGDW